LLPGRDVLRGGFDLVEARPLSACGRCRPKFGCPG